ncbi:hypothetical protein ACRRTK_019465 [Alexandromys fortis]
MHKSAVSCADSHRAICRKARLREMLAPQMLQPVPSFPDLLSKEFADQLCPPLVWRFQNYILS